MSDVTACPETWRDVVGFEGSYQVSDLGRVRSVTREVVYRNGRCRIHRGRILLPNVNRNGYHMVMLYRGGKPSARYVHRLVAAAFIGPLPLGLQVCHGNGDGADNRVSNLRYDTPSENMRDCVRHGTNRNAGKTSCPRDHVLADPNLVSWAIKEGMRTCLACDRARTRISRAKRAGGIVPDLQVLSDQIYADLMVAAAA